MKELKEKQKQVLMNLFKDVDSLNTAINFYIQSAKDGLELDAQYVFDRDKLAFVKKEEPKDEE